jgi:hypothetical protein
LRRFNVATSETMSISVQRAIEPLHQDGGQRPHEQDVAEHGDRGGHRCPGYADVLSEVAGVRQPQKGPPDRLAGGFEAGGNGAHQ